MPRIVEFEGRRLSVPDDATDDEIAELLEMAAVEPAQPQQAPPLDLGAVAQNMFAPTLRAATGTLGFPGTAAAAITDGPGPSAVQAFGDGPLARFWDDYVQPALSAPRTAVNAAGNFLSAENMTEGLLGAGVLPSREPSGLETILELAMGAGVGAGLVGGLRKGAVDGTQLLDDFVQTFRQAPGRTVAVETGSGAGAGAGLALGQNIAPDSPMAQAGLAVAGGAGAPGAASLAGTGARAVSRTMNKGAAETEAARQLREAAYRDPSAAATGNDAVSSAVQEIDRTTAATDMPLTATQASNNMGIKAIEEQRRVADPSPFISREQEQQRYLGGQVDQLRPDFEETADDTKLFIEGVVDDTRQRQTAAETEAAARRAAAEEQRVAAGARQDETLRSPPLEDSAGASRQLAGELRAAQMDAKQLERNPRFNAAREASEGAQFSFQPVAERAAGIAAEQGKRGEVHPLVREAAAALDEDGAVDTFTDIEGFRKRITTALREDPGNRQLVQLKAGVDDLIGQAETGGPDVVGMTPEARRTFQEANRYEREDYAPRFRDEPGFYDDPAQGKGQRNRFFEGKVPEENVAQYYVRADGAQGAGAAAKALVETVGDRPAAVDAVRRYALGEAGKLRDNKGRVNPDKFLEWYRRRSQALKAFPELDEDFGTYQKAFRTVKDDVEAADVAVKGATEAETGVKAANKAEMTALTRENEAVRRFLGADPEKAVAGILDSPNSEKAMNDAVRIARRDKSGKALRGLERAVGDTIAERARSATDKVTLQKVKSTYNRNKRALKALYTQIHGEKGAAEKLKTLEKTQNELLLIERAFRKGIRGSDTATKIQVPPQLVSGLFIRAFGLVTGNYVMMISRGSKDLIANLTEAQAREILTKAMLDPQLARTLLMKATPANEAIIRRRLGAYLPIMGSEATMENDDDG